MQDRSHLDRKYFIDHRVYNCPFCNRRNVRYDLDEKFSFHWTGKKVCYVYFVVCSDCDSKSMHLSFEYIVEHGYFKRDIDIDSKIFYSVPTSFFIMDTRIPAIIRELITEGEGCLKMNYLTGASACIRKAIYELIFLEKCEGQDYESKIKALKAKYTEVDPSLFDILAAIQDMTSEKVHEQSWDKWDSQNLKLITEALKTVLHQMYVIPAERKASTLEVMKLREGLKKDKGKSKEEESKS